MESIKKNNSAKGMENFIGMLLLIYVFIPFSSSIKQVTYILLIFVSLLYFKINERTRNMSGYFVCFIFCIIWSLIGAFYTVQGTVAYRFVFRLLGSLIFSVFCITSNISADTIKKWLVYLGYVCVVATLLQMLFPSPMASLAKLVLDSESYTNYRYSYHYFNSYYGICTTSYENALYISYAFFGSLISFVSKDKKFKYFIAMALSLIALFATQKRSIILCTMVCTALYAIYIVLGKKISSAIKSTFIISFIFVVLVGIIFINFTETGQRLSERLFVDVDSINLSNRDVMFENIWNKSQDSLLFGHGTASAYSIYSIGVHNIYLQLLYENGIIGVVLFVVLFATVLLKTWKINRSSSDRSVYEFSLLCQMLFIAYGMSGNTIYYSNTLMLYTLYVCMSGCVRGGNETDEDMCVDFSSCR